MVSRLKLELIPYILVDLDATICIITIPKGANSEELDLTLGITCLY